MVRLSGNDPFSISMDPYLIPFNLPPGKIDVPAASTDQEGGVMIAKGDVGGCPYIERRKSLWGVLLFVLEAGEAGHNISSSFSRFSFVLEKNNIENERIESAPCMRFS